MDYPTIEQLKSFFFRAMLNSGWVGGGKIAESTKREGYKIVRFLDEEEGLLLIDTWCSGGGGHSSGSTTIYMDRQEGHDGRHGRVWVPVWTMSYMGRYDDEAIPTVKNALRVAYQSNHFFGGRGPVTFNQDGWHYRNSIASHSTDDMFTFFEGQEDVADRNETLRGFHSFTGMLLFDRNDA